MNKLASHLAQRAFRSGRSTLNYTSQRLSSSTDYSPKCDGLVIEPKEQVLWIKFNRPTKFNAISREMYSKLIDTFKQVNNDEAIKALVLTGTGNYYSSGNDLTNFTQAMKHEGGFKEGMAESSKILYDFVDSLINLEKLLIAAVNGPAIGIAVTTLPLCDYVIASDKATFQTPFTSLGQCAEACSSLTFPQILGKSKSSELLLLNMTWDAKKAQNNGLISEAVDSDRFQEFLENLLYGKHGIVKNCYPNALMKGKALVRSPDQKQKLVDTNRRECEQILELWLGEECNDAVQKFFARQAKKA